MFEFWSTSEYTYSAPSFDEFRFSFSVFFVLLWVGGWVGGGGVPLPAGGSPRPLRDDFWMILGGFGYPLESPEGHFGGHFRAGVSNWSVYVDFLGAFWEG